MRRRGFGPGGTIESGFVPRRGVSPAHWHPVNSAATRAGRCRRQFAAHVRRHQVVVIRARLAQQLLVQIERALDVVLRNATNRVADVIEDVVADGDRLVDDLEPHFTPQTLNAVARAFCRGSPVLALSRAIAKAVRQETRWLLNATHKQV